MALGKSQPPSTKYPMGVTVDGVPIHDGLVVFTNEYKAGVVDGDSMRPHNPGWFDVVYPGGGRCMQNAERVATVFEGERAVDVLAAAMRAAQVVAEAQDAES